MPRTGKVTRLWNIQKIQKRRTKPNRKAYYLCRGMISQAILVWKFARDPHNCLFRAQQGVCIGGGQAAAAELGWGREAAAHRWRSNLPCSQPASCCSQPPNFSERSYSAIRSLPLHISTAVHSDLCSREAAEAASQSEDQLLQGLKALLLLLLLQLLAGLPNSGNSKLSSEPFHRRACPSGESNQ